MTADWILGLGNELAKPSLRFHQVLVEYDGPQVALFRDDVEKQFIGVAAESREEGARWICAPISSTELRALALGAEAVYDAIVKVDCFVVDISDDHTILGAWQIAGADIDPAFLPEPGAMLPRAARALLPQQANTAPEFQLNAAEGKGVSFTATAAVLDVTQRLWSAIGQAVNAAATTHGRWTDELKRQTALSLEAAAPGSLALQIRPAEHAMFNRISTRFELIVRAGGDRDALAAQIELLGERVHARYEELLQVLSRHRLQLLTNRPDGAAFLAHHTAPRILEALESVSSEVNEFELVGMFIGFDVFSGTFKFYDPYEDEVYEGKLLPAFQSTAPNITVGFKIEYQVAIGVVRTKWVSGKAAETYTLLSARLQTPAADASE